MSNQAFLKAASVAAAISALTTIAVHFIDFQADTFEQRLLMARNPLYLQHRWMIIIHCLMVIISMCGVAVMIWRLNKGLAALGMLFFSVFGIAEITRMLSVLAYLNPMREKYLAATDQATLQILQLQIESFSQAATILFLVFILGFAIGNLCYGLALVFQSRTDRWMGAAFLLLALFTFLSFGNAFWNQTGIGSIVEQSGKYYTPLMRCAAAAWLWTKAATG